MIDFVCILSNRAFIFLEIDVLLLTSVPGSELVTGFSLSGNHFIDGGDLLWGLRLGRLFNRDTFRLDDIVFRYFSFIA